MGRRAEVREVGRDRRKWTIGAKNCLVVSVTGLVVAMEVLTGSEVCVDVPGHASGQ